MNTNQWDKYAKIFDQGIGDGKEKLHSQYIDPLIFKYLGKKHYGHIADLGCGNGYLLNRLDKYSEKISGLDYSKSLKNR